MLLWGRRTKKKGAREVISCCPTWSSPVTHRVSVRNFSLLSAASVYHRAKGPTHPRFPGSNLRTGVGTARGILDFFSQTFCLLLSLLITFSHIKPAPSSKIHRPQTINVPRDDFHKNRRLLKTQSKRQFPVWFFGARIKIIRFLPISFFPNI